MLITEKDLARTPIGKCEVVQITGAGLAREVARLRARFVIKDSSKADD